MDAKWCGPSALEERFNYGATWVQEGSVWSCWHALSKNANELTNLCKGPSWSHKSLGSFGNPQHTKIYKKHAENTCRHGQTRTSKQECFQGGGIIVLGCRIPEDGKINKPCAIVNTMHYVGCWPPLKKTRMSPQECHGMISPPLETFFKKAPIQNRSRGQKTLVFHNQEALWCFSYGH